MKKHVFTFLFTLNLLNAFAQVNPSQKLQVLIDKYPEADTFKVNRLTELSKLTDLSLAKRDSIADEAIQISKDINYNDGLLKAMIAKSLVTSETGDRNKTQTILKQAFDIAQQEKKDSLSIVVLNTLAHAQAGSVNTGQAMANFMKAYQLALKFGNLGLISNCERQISAYYLISLTDYARALDWGFKSMKDAEKADCKPCLITVWTNISTIYTSLSDHDKALFYLKKILALNKKLGVKDEFVIFNSIGERYRLTNNYEKAIEYYQLSINVPNTPLSSIEIAESNLADVYDRQGNTKMAFQYANKSLKEARELKDIEGIAWINGILARTFLKTNQIDSALKHGKEGYEAGLSINNIEYLRDNSYVLSKAYAQQGNFASAYKYQSLYIAHRDSMLNEQVTNQSSLMQYNYDMQKKQAEITVLNKDRQLQTEASRRQRIFLIATLVGLTLIAALLAVVFRNSRHKQKANELLQKQKAEIQQQRDQTDKALSDLKLTQTQLIQSEKMASLGELTAGIAHEIQNPLNFVNNFSEVSIELLEEMETEFKAGNAADAMEIAEDIKLNLEKINHHGKRADSIVKGMLQHSRSSNGQKESTDINALADEYLRLSYHGLRAKNKAFNATMQTNFDEHIGRVDILAQDVGRVMLNLFTNAFYSVTEKKALKGDGYEPVVSVTTKKINTGDFKGVEITIRDNGMGIPQKVLEKIYQPFFTTKPTGQGTGLGLSMSYDIITKSHNGQINVETKEGEFAEFVIKLPA